MAAAVDFVVGMPLAYGLALAAHAYYAGSVIVCVAYARDPRACIVKSTYLWRASLGIRAPSLAHNDHYPADRLSRAATCSAELPASPAKPDKKSCKVSWSGPSRAPTSA